MRWQRGYSNKPVWPARLLPAFPTPCLLTLRTKEIDCAAHSLKLPSFSCSRWLRQSLFSHAPHLGSSRRFLVRSLQIRQSWFVSLLQHTSQLQSSTYIMQLFRSGNGLGGSHCATVQIRCSCGLAYFFLWGGRVYRR